MDHGFGAVREGLVVAGQAAVMHEPAEGPLDTRRRHRLARVVNAVGAGVTALVLVIVLATKFTQGAWLAVLVGILLWLMMGTIRRHYDAVAAELAVRDPRAALTPPPRVTAVVLVPAVDRPTLRALAYTRAFKTDRPEALAVALDREAAAARQWRDNDIDVPLRIADSPYREVTRPVVDHVRNIRRESPRDVVGVFIPEYVVGRWWETLLHNQSALWLRTRLLFLPGVMVTGVPWQLASAARASEAGSRAPGSVRLGEPDPAHEDTTAGSHRSGAQRPGS